MKCDHCKKEEATLKRHDQKTDWMRGNDEVWHLCKECYSKKDKLFPDWEKPARGPAYYPENRVKKILALQQKGRIVKKVSDYQFRIDGILDLFPVNMRFHNIKTNERGDIPYSVF